MINATREKLKTMEVVDWIEGGSAIRESFIEEIAFDLDHEGLVWIEPVEIGKKGV